LISAYISVSPGALSEQVNQRLAAGRVATGRPAQRLAQRRVDDINAALDINQCHNVYTYLKMARAGGIRYFFLNSLFRYFNAPFRFRYTYSATFQDFAIRYSLFAIATLV
jgi:hypothetical protein